MKELLPLSYGHFLNTYTPLTVKLGLSHGITGSFLPIMKI